MTTDSGRFTVDCCYPHSLTGAGESLFLRGYSVRYLHEEDRQLLNIPTNKEKTGQKLDSGSKLKSLTITTRIMLHLKIKCYKKKNSRSTIAALPQASNLRSAFSSSLAHRFNQVLTRKCDCIHTCAAMCSVEPGVQVTLSEKRLICNLFSVHLASSHSAYNWLLLLLSFLLL